MKKLWQKNTFGKLSASQDLDSFVEEFETKTDLVMDQKLIPYDIQGSIAHAKGLLKIGILTAEECAKLETGLNEILKLYKEDKFIMEPGDEDMHTKIEDFLTQNYGEVGKKIHTGRSRNDQVLTAIRLFEKAKLEKIKKVVKELIVSFENFEKQYGEIPMPGYTHMQKAMPSTVGMWIGSFIASLEDDLKVLSSAYELIDQSPLGSGAGYGLPIELDKNYTAKLLDFNKVIENPIYAQSSKGKFEAFILSALIQILQTINKFASDVLLFSTQEFGFLKASAAIITGSSIMPQKKNIDLAELLRSKLHVALGNQTQIVSMTSNLISGYNRDLADIKKPLIESFETTLNSLKAAKILLVNITPDKEKLEKVMTPELFAAEEALKLTQSGLSFRDAYKKVGESYE